MVSVVPKGVSPFRDEPYFQMDGSEFESSNCVLATCTELIGRITVGRLRVTAKRLRVLSGDTVNGLTYGQAAIAVLKATSNEIKLEPRFGLDRDQVRDLAAAGRPFGISIDCSVTITTTRRTGTYTGGHTVYVGDYEFRQPPPASGCSCERNATDNHGEFLVEDPGTHATHRWWSAGLLYRAAEKCGGGAINVLVGPDTEGVQRKGAMKGRIREQADVTSADLGPVVQGKVYTVLATVNGGPWKRDDGGEAFGWHQIDHNGKTAFVAGERLQP